MKDVIFLDFDGVCINLLTGLSKYFSKEFGKEFKPDGVATYGFGGDIGEVNRTDVYSALKIAEPYLLAEYEPHDKDAFLQLREVFEVIPYTAVPDCVRDIRLNQIKALGFGLDDESLIYVGDKDVPNLNKYRGRKVYLVEDNPATILMWLQDSSVTQTVCVEHLYNREFLKKYGGYNGKLVSVLNFQDMIDYFLGIYKNS